MLPYASFGIDEVDKLLGGGLVRGNCYLLEVEPGTAELDFIAAYLDEGLRESDSCILILHDCSHQDFITRLIHHGLDLGKSLDSGSILIADLSEAGRYDPDRRSNILTTENPSDPNSVLRIYYDMTQINEAKLKTGKFKGTRAIVYSLSSEIMSYKFEPTYKLAKRGISIAKRFNGMSLSLLNPKMIDDTVVAAFEHLFDGVIVLTMKETRGRFQRFIRVKQSPLSGHYADEVPYDVVSNKARLITPFAEPISTFRNQVRYGADGSLDVLGMRLTMTEATYIPALMEHFVGILGYERLSEEVYTFFKNYGKTLFRKLLLSLNIELAKMDQKILFDTFAGFITAFGLGIVKLLSFSDDLVSFRVTNSLCTESVRTGKPMNPYLAGMFAGVVESVLSKPIKCVELKCVAKGDDCCEFVCNIDMVKTLRKASDQQETLHQSFG